MVTSWVVVDTAHFAQNHAQETWLQAVNWRKHCHPSHNAFSPLRTVNVLLWSQNKLQHRPKSVDVTTAAMASSWVVMGATNSARKFVQEGWWQGVSWTILHEHC
jgi:hypothetical protein